MKTLLFLATIICMVVLSTIFIGLAPYHMYSLAINEGLNANFFQFRALPIVNRNGKLFKYQDQKGVEDVDKTSWQTLHFTHFKFPIPIHHPLFVIRPTIEEKVDINKRQLFLGFELKDQSKLDILSFQTWQKRKFEIDLGSNKLFKLPIFKNGILKTNKNKIWQDIFLKRLSLSPLTSGHLIENIEKNLSIPYKELVYNLFIARMRRLILPANAINLSYHKSGKMGVIEIPDKKSHTEVPEGMETEDIYKQEIFYVLKNGFIYTFKLRSKTPSLVASMTRKKIVENIVFKKNTKKSARFIFSLYKNLPYKRRVSNEGMIYLYICWSHEIDNPEYLKNMIRFLERNDSNQEYLKPFYDYAYKNFGSNFSGLDNKLKENAMMKLKRQREKEVQLEIDREKARPASVDDKFESDQKKIDYFLKKAKEHGINSDDFDQKLEMD